MPNRSFLCFTGTPHPITERCLRSSTSRASDAALSALDNQVFMSVRIFRRRRKAEAFRRTGSSAFGQAIEEHAHTSIPVGHVLHSKEMLRKTTGGNAGLHPTCTRAYKVAKRRKSALDFYRTGRELLVGQVRYRCARRSRGPDRSQNLGRAPALLLGGHRGRRNFLRARRQRR